ncbi:uncharacterized protein I303_100263 [Kwoniella dejecticola CBS 10117]|uniref:Uncharacterized protein n=1 Tax=Kwoniella dejecticola CBS 10117 TaxID=1296121 RepID=A0A1A6AEE6_9TREE|nr:uncharacterized protein I303_00264 [Kwoniella dejecticola CBS 10117]OBR88447.1 hypothetical protein I303_00264 [Kwoniella dejecticola CBS 10117]
MCDIATLFNTNPNADLCCFDSIECANYLCGAQDSTVDQSTTSGTNGTVTCYLDQMVATENYDKAPDGVCTGNMLCALKALSTEPSVTVDQALLPTSVTTSPSSSASASTAGSTSAGIQRLDAGFVGTWGLVVLGLSIFGKKLIM